MDVALISN